ncbi:MAG TPA: hypothetical protein VNA29_04485, partial [Sphingomicrobium sp.]|nr:hypothetical protein [Sphingomicrobium sp.]
MAIGKLEPTPVPLKTNMPCGYGSRSRYYAAAREFWFLLRQGRNQMLASSSHKMALLAGAAFVALAAAGSASAQSSPAAPAALPAQPSTPPNEEAERDDTIVVTGTRIVRDGFSAPTPVTVMTQEEIENSSPTNNIADFVNQLPALAGSIRPANSRLELSNGIAG